MTSRKTGKCRSVFVLAYAVACTLALSGAALAQMPTPAVQAQSAARDAAPMDIAIDMSITVRADRSAEVLTTRRVKVLSEGAVQFAGQFAQKFIEGMETLRIVKAYTIKSDGREIAVEPSEIITRDASSGSLFHLRDLKISTVVFSDVAVGDTVVTVTQRNQARGFFPSQYVGQILFARTIPYSRSTIHVAAPTDLDLKVATLGAGLQDKVAVDGANTIHAIDYQPLPRQYGEAGSTSPLDHDPRVLISTFASYEDMARSYWAEARDRAKVTPEIQTLADTITAGIADRRAQAVAIDRWVKRNIRYIAIYLGVGRVVPYAAASVLKRKFGDCKDHATLMTALLAAKGIASEHVLINSANAYTLPEPATMAYINHVILYLPEFGVYDDPTASYAAFGVLGNGSYDKPVLRVSDAGARRAHTPAMKAADHTTINRTTITIAADGTMTGETEQIATGVFASGARHVATIIQNIGPNRAAEKILQNMHTPGSGRFDICPVSALDKTYVVKSKFTYAARMHITPRALRPIPLGAPILVRPGEYLLGKRIAGRRLPFMCGAGRQIEEIALTFADGFPRPRRLNGRTIDTRLFSYASHYMYSGNTMTVRRVFESHVPGQVCAPELEAEIAAGLSQVRGSMNTRLYFPTATAGPNTVARNAPPATQLGPHDW